MVIEVVMILVALAVLGLILFQAYVMLTRPKPKTGSSSGKVIVVDHTKPDTSKEDALNDRFGEFLNDKEDMK